MKCGRCSSGGMTSIRVQLGDGTEIELTSCRKCEWKRWRSAAGDVSLAEVLDLAAAHRPR